MNNEAASRDLWVRGAGRRPAMALTRGMKGLAWGVLPALLAACGGSPPAPEPGTAATPIAVTVAVATVETVADVVEASGVVEPWQRVMPGTKILGRISEVKVREGDRVERGQLLARLEDRDLEAAVEQARAGIAMAEARVEKFAGAV